MTCENDDDVRVQSGGDSDSSSSGSKGRVSLRSGKGLLSVAAWSLPITVMVVLAPFISPLSRLQLDTLKGQLEKQACDLVEVR